MFAFVTYYNSFGRSFFKDWDRERDKPAARYEVQKKIRMLHLIELSHSSQVPASVVLNEHEEGKRGSQRVSTLSMQIGGLQFESRLRTIPKSLTGLGGGVIILKRQTISFTGLPIQQMPTACCDERMFPTFNYFRLSNRPA